MAEHKLDHVGDVRGARADSCRVVGVDWHHEVTSGIYDAVDGALGACVIVAAAKLDKHSGNRGAGAAAGGEGMGNHAYIMPSKRSIGQPSTTVFFCVPGPIIDHCGS